MPDTNFYLTDHSRELLFDFIQSQGGELVPDLHYDKPEYEIVKDVNQFMEYIETKTVRFYIISKKFQERDLWVNENELMAPPNYYIVQRVGGPYIHLALYRGWADDATVKMKSTHVGYYARFLDKDDFSIEYKASEELKDFYKGMLKFLRSLCKKVNINGKNYYIDKNSDGD